MEMPCTRLCMKLHALSGRSRFLYAKKQGTGSILRLACDLPTMDGVGDDCVFCSVALAGAHRREYEKRKMEVSWQKRISWYDVQRPRYAHMPRVEYIIYIASGLCTGRWSGIIQITSAQITSSS